MMKGKPLLTVEQIQTRVRELGELITEDYAGKSVVVVGLLRGAFMFLADLVRQIRVPVTVDFMTVSSYVKNSSTGEISIHCDLRENIRDKDVIIVEDIADTGITLNRIRQRLLELKPRSVAICAFLDKKEKRVEDVPLDYVGFEIPNQFVVGYGLDYENRFRNLPYIAIFKEDD